MKAEEIIKRTDTVKRYWNICAVCYNRFLRGAQRCPRCGSEDFTKVLAKVSEAEIEQARQEIDG